MGEEVFFDEFGFDYAGTEIDILEHLQSIENMISNLERTSIDLLNFVMFCFPLLIGIVIGLVAVKTFWEGASRW